MKDHWISTTLRNDPTWQEVMRRLKAIRTAKESGCLVVGEEQT